MSSLTEQERRGLEEVFLSISTNRKAAKRVHNLRENLQRFLKAQRIKERLLMPLNALTKARIRLKKGNFPHLNPKKSKKKKNLS